jgi:Leucine-rich repeat (LRR) protein
MKHFNEWKYLQRLKLSENPIEDITPLAQLDSFLQVYLVFCPVKDFSPVDHVGFVEPYERKAVFE